MPGYDGTGPLGYGPMTGRGRGYCVIELPENGELPNTASKVLSEMREPVFPDLSLYETAQLGIRVRQMQFALTNLNHKINILVNNRERIK